MGACRVFERTAAVGTAGKARHRTRVARTRRPDPSPGPVARNHTGGYKPPMPIALNIAYLAALVAAAPYLAWRAWRTGRYRSDLATRLRGPSGPLPAGGSVVWFHGVSVGEIRLLQPLVADWKRHRPADRVLVTASTDTGLHLARAVFAADSVRRLPLDFTWAVRRALDHWRPDLLVLAEQELWPNLLRGAARRGVPVAVVNARMGRRSGRWHARLAKPLRPSLAAVRWWGAQDEPTADRIRSLVGDSGAAVESTGSLKFDGQTVTDRTPPGGDPVLVAGSTAEGEEAIVLDAWQTLRRDHPKLRLVLVPRSPDRFEEVATLLRDRGESFVRRSDEPQRAVQAWSPLPDVLLVNAVGELRHWWGRATVGFVGGSFDGRRQGQSMIEPAAVGVPACFGPHVDNFRTVATQLCDADAAVMLDAPERMAEVLRTWLADPERAATVGDAARRFVLAQQGATARTGDALRGLLTEVARRRCA